MQQVYIIDLLIMNNAYNMLSNSWLIIRKKNGTKPIILKIARVVSKENSVLANQSNN